MQSTSGSGSLLRRIALLNQTAQYGQVDEHVLFGRVQPLMLSVTVDLVAL